MVNNRLHFLAETNNKGYTYVRSYKTQWDKVKKISRAYRKRHVGRLLDTGRVAICESFRNDYPEYAEGNWYWGANKTLISEEEYFDTLGTVVTQELDASICRAEF